MNNFIALFVIMYMILGGGTTLKPEEIKNEQLKNIDININESLILVADNQFHNIYCDPSFPCTKLIDIFNDVAIRPPQLSLFAPDFFVFSLKEDAKNKKIIHLGDALNIASSYEWKEFLKAMKGVNNMGWVMIPGNHDFYYQGNVAGKPDLENVKCGRSGWVDAANTTGVQREFYPIIKDVPFTKDLFIKEYIKAIVAQPYKGFPEEKQIISIYKDKNKKILKPFFEWKNEVDKPFINRIAGHYYDDYYYWRSFIVQELSVENDSTGKNYKIILLDTTDYKKRPSFRGFIGYIPWFTKKIAGGKGEISKFQQDIVTRWIIENNNDNFILIGHHPFKNLTKDTKKWIEKYKKTYISAHTHDPKKTHTYFNKYEKEINIGSITDTPKKKLCREELYEPSPQYAILKGGNSNIQDKTAKNIIEKVIDDSCLFQLEQKKKRFFGFFNKKSHRNNIRILAKTYLDMFNFFEEKNMYQDLEFLNAILNNELIRIKDQLLKIYEDDDIGKHEVIKYINILKEAKSIDDKLKDILNQQYCNDRRLYGAWVALKASLLEANYYIDNDSKSVKVKQNGPVSCLINRFSVSYFSSD